MINQLVCTDGENNNSEKVGGDVGVAYHVCRILLEHVFVSAAHLFQFPVVPCRCLIVQTSERTDPG